LKKISGWLANNISYATTLLSFYTGYLYFFEAVRAAVLSSIIPFSHTWLSFSEGVSIDMGAILRSYICNDADSVSFVSLMVAYLQPRLYEGRRKIPGIFFLFGIFYFFHVGFGLFPPHFQLYIFWELGDYLLFS
jgi:NADH-quinone oxidoreductase subunit L